MNSFYELEHLMHDEKEENRDNYKQNSTKGAEEKVEIKRIKDMTCKISDKK